MRCATVYQRANGLIIHPSSQTTEGVWVAASPCVCIPDSAPDCEVGSAVRRALEASSVGVPHPEEFHAVTEQILRVAGVATWRAFAASTRCVEIEEIAPGLLSLIPTQNLHGGFVPRKDTLRADAADDNDKLGRATRTALDAAGAMTGHRRP